MIFIGEAASGPANVRHLYRFQRSDNIVANPPCIRDFGIAANPNAFINAVSKMLGELPEDVAVDLRASLGDVNGELDFLCSRRARN